MNYTLYPLLPICLQYVRALKYPSGKPAADRPGDWGEQGGQLRDGRLFRPLDGRRSLLDGYFSARPHGIGKPASVQNKTRGQIGFLNMLPTLFFALPPKPMREAPQDNPQLP